MADEQNQEAAQARHKRNMDRLRDLRGDCEYRLNEIVNRYYDRQMDDESEVAAVREGMRADLRALQRRIDETINSLL